MKQVEIQHHLDSNKTQFPSPKALGTLLWRNINILLVTSFLGLLFGLYRNVEQIPMYRSTLSMLIQSQSQNLAKMGDSFFLDARSFRYYETQQRIMKSQAVLKRVVDKLQLDKPSDRYKYNLPINFSQSVLNFLPIKTVAKGRKDNITSVSFANKIAAINYIKAGLQLTTTDDSEFVEASFVSVNPDLSADIVNALASSYQEYLRESKSGLVNKASAWLLERLDEISGQLREAEFELSKFRAKEKTTGTKDLDAKLTKKSQDLRQDYEQEKLEYQRIERRYGIKHPKFSSAKLALRDATIALEQGEAGVIQSREKEFELARLEANLESLRNLHEMFMQRHQEASVVTDTQLNDVELLDEAQPSVTSYSLSRLSKNLIGVFVGLLVGVFFVLARFYLGNTFKSHVDVESRLSLPVLSVLPKVQKFSSGDEVLYRNSKRHIYTESINRIRSSLQYWMDGKPARSIQVTSSVESEGKSTLAFNLALAMAELNKKTILIDADLRRPVLKKTIGLVDEKQGLSDWLGDNIGIANIIHQHVIDQNLSVITSGSNTSRASELLHSEKFSKLIKVLENSFDHVIIDSPPILPVADSLEVARRVDATVFVIEAEKTPISIVKQAVEQLESECDAKLGVVLNKLSANTTEYYYPTKYYGYYEKEAKNTEEESFES